MTKTQSAELSRLQYAIKQAMVSICYHNASNMYVDNRTETVDHDIDIAFMAIGCSFPDFHSIQDTVTRRCAKTEIYDILRSLKTASTRDYLMIIEQQSDIGDTVMEDIINMTDDDSDEIDLDFDVTTDNKVS
jgi:hypothetical protein